MHPPPPMQHLWTPCTWGERKGIIWSNKCAPSAGGTRQPRLLWPRHKEKPACQIPECTGIYTKWLPKLMPIGTASLDAACFWYRSWRRGPCQCGQEWRNGRRCGCMEDTRCILVGHIRSGWWRSAEHQSDEGRRGGVPKVPLIRGGILSMEGMEVIWQKKGRLKQDSMWRNDSQKKKNIYCGESSMIGTKRSSSWMRKECWRKRRVQRGRRGSRVWRWSRGGGCRRERKWQGRINWKLKKCKKTSQGIYRRRRVGSWGQNSGGKKRVGGGRNSGGHGSGSCEVGMTMKMK